MGDITHVKRLTFSDFGDKLFVPFIVQQGALVLVCPFGFRGRCLGEGG